ncbi:MAG: NAD-dependent protein deacetylase [Pseudomonadales bacterium]
MKGFAAKPLPASAVVTDDYAALIQFIERAQRLFVLTGAGISAASGIATYRDDAGTWQSGTPTQHQQFINDEYQRRRYWARSMLGWPVVSRAQPNGAHFALAALEQKGKLTTLVTQNVDRLHQRAGHQQVIDLHGRLDQVVCLDCQRSLCRNELQQALQALNPQLGDFAATPAPDGDAKLAEDRVADVRYPDCTACGGVLMPNVVFFGGTVPAGQVAQAMQALQQADAMLVVGSSLMVYSGYRFCRAAAQLGMPIAALNLGTTRADHLLALKVTADCRILGSV